MSELMLLLGAVWWCRCALCCSTGSGGREKGVWGCGPDGEDAEECNGEAAGEGEG